MLHVPWRGRVDAPGAPDGLEGKAVAVASSLRLATTFSAAALAARNPQTGAPIRHTR